MPLVLDIICSKEIVATALLIIFFIWRDISYTARVRRWRWRRWNWIKNNLISRRKIKKSSLSSPSIVICTSFNYPISCSAFVFQEYSAYDPFIQLIRRILQRTSELMLFSKNNSFLHFNSFHPLTLQINALSLVFLITVL